MGQLQRALHKNLATLPKLMLRRILERKLGEQEIDLPPAAFEALLDHMLSHNDQHFTWTDGGADTGQQPRNLELIFDEKDTAQAQELSDRLITTIPEIIETIADKSGADLFNTLRKNWAIEGMVQRYEIDEFRDRLEHRWGEGLQILRMLLTVVRELGHEAIRETLNKAWVRDGLTGEA
jgi:hypothetical protein